MRYLSKSACILCGHINETLQLYLQQLFKSATKRAIVRMLGTGQPFLIEIQITRQFPSGVLIKDIEIKINSLESKFGKESEFFR
ncbi:hypothetical protein OROMI_011442 [Orobanche minor]